MHPTLFFMIWYDVLGRVLDNKLLFSRSSTKDTLDLAFMHEQWIHYIYKVEPQFLEIIRAELSQKFFKIISGKSFTFIIPPSASPSGRNIQLFGHR